MSEGELNGSFEPYEDQFEEFEEFEPYDDPEVHCETEELVSRDKESILSPKATSTDLHGQTTIIESMTRNKITVKLPDKIQETSEPELTFAKDSVAVSSKNHLTTSKRCNSNFQQTVSHDLIGSDYSESVTSGSEYLPSNSEEDNSDSTIESDCSESSIRSTKQIKSHEKKKKGIVISNELDLSDEDEDFCANNLSKSISKIPATKLSDKIPVTRESKVTKAIANIDHPTKLKSHGTHFQQTASYDLIELASNSESVTSEPQDEPTGNEKNDSDSSIKSDDSESSIMSDKKNQLNKKKKKGNFVSNESDISDGDEDFSSKNCSKRLTKKPNPKISESKKNDENMNISTQDNTVTNDKLNVSSDVSGLSSLENSFLNINLKSVGQALKNKNTEVITSSTDGCKKNSCLYCISESIKKNDKTKRVLYTRLPDHYEAKHPKEKQVMKLIKLKKIIEKLKKKGKNSSKVKEQELARKRKKILDMLRIKANHLNNTHADEGKQYVVRRRPTGKGRILADYIPCFHCTQYYSQNSLRKHVRKCTGLSFKKKHSIKSRARATLGNYHELATEASIKLISKMRESKALDQIRYDDAVFMWLNAEANRCETKKHIENSVRASLNRLGTLMMEIKKINEHIEELSDMFNEDYYNDFIKVVKIMGKPHPDTAFLQSPATAYDMFNLIIHVSEIYEVNLGRKFEDERLKVQAFLRKLKKMWKYDIGTTILETQARIRRNKVIQLPDDSDTKKLNAYLLEKILESYNELKKKYSDTEYENFRNAILCYFQSSNARRPGEVERMEMEDYENTQTDGEDCLIIPRGKRRRGVPIVFNTNEKRFLDFLVSCRAQAGIFEKNPYVFATIHDIDTDDFKYVSACQLMSQFAISSKAEHPETLRGTRIRMKVATNGMEEGLPEAEVNKFADFLGHTPNIHKQNYRQSVFRSDVAISKQVKAFQGINVNNISSNSNEKIDKGSQKSLPSKRISVIEDSNSETTAMDIDQPDTFGGPIEKDQSIQNDNSDIITSKASPSSVKARPAKIPWKQPQINELLQHFPNALDLQYKVPAVKDIVEFIRKTKDPILKMRTDGQIRTWIHLQRNQKKNDSHLPERDHIPSYIYGAFKKHIDAGKEPSHTTCVKFLAQSPSKDNITVSNLQKWVSLAIKKKRQV